MLITLVIMLSACGGDEPARIDPAPEVKPKSNSELPPKVTTTPAAPVPVVDPLLLTDGRRIYAHYCTDCHDAGAGHPGTMRLGVRLGAEKSELKAREDLTQDLVKSIVRNGLGMMPPFRPSEITDAELDPLAVYIVNANKQLNGKME